MSDREKLSTDPYKGVRDFYPEEMWEQEYIYTTWSWASEAFGYQRYDASVLEPSDIYKTKSGEEIINEQTYTFIDRGDREVTLRPEMTPSVARMVAAKKRELAFPLRWYSMPNLFRYERPQRGRLREHWQLNCDIFGVDTIDADLEIIMLADTIMRGFGATEKDFDIHINHMGIIREVLTDLQIPETEWNKVRKLLDERNKIDDFDSKIHDLLGVNTETLDQKFADAETTKELLAVKDELAKLGVTNVSIDHTIVRGQDYYTGVIFEVFDVSPENNRSMFGGGRYDNLTDLFGGEATSAVGFGMGDVTIRDFLRTHGLMPTYRSRSDLYLATLSPEIIPYAQGFAQELRSSGLNVAVNMADKKISDQLKIADKKHIPFVIVIGDDEVDSGNYKLKHMESGDEIEVTKDTIEEAINEKSAT